MKRNREQQSVTLSVLDRLIDTDPSAQDRLWVTRNESLSKLKNSLSRDLEWLLNTRRVDSPNPTLRELNRSAFVYGMPDLTRYSLDSVSDRTRLVRELTAAIELFEPRLDEVSVVALEGEQLSHSLRFRIDGMLRTEAAPEPVSFDTVLELSCGEYQVKGEA